MQKRWVFPLRNIDYYASGLFRLAVIAQQIYYRFYHGQTKDERFKLMIFAVHVWKRRQESHCTFRSLKEGMKNATGPILFGS